MAEAFDLAERPTKYVDRVEVLMLIDGRLPEEDRECGDRDVRGGRPPKMRGGAAV